MSKFEISESMINVDDCSDECFTNPIRVAFLNDEEYEFLLEGYADDHCKEDFKKAINSFINLDKNVLYDVSEYVYQYYQEKIMITSLEDENYIKIDKPQDVWEFVQFGHEHEVSRRDYDSRIYISLECNCDWEPEHGLQLVFKNGCYINKLGPYDGHLANSDAFGDESLEDVIYKKI